MVRGNRKGSPSGIGGRIGGAALHPELFLTSRGGFGRPTCSNPIAGNLRSQADAGPGPLIQSSGDRPEEIGRNSCADYGHGGDDADRNQAGDEAVFDGYSSPANWMNELIMG
jgi:hypothetical protein